MKRESYEAVAGNTVCEPLGTHGTSCQFDADPFHAQWAQGDDGDMNLSVVGEGMVKNASSIENLTLVDASLDLSP